MTVRFSKRHYVEIAALLRVLPFSTDDPCTYRQRLIGEFVKVFLADNPKFSLRMFTKAVNLYKKDTP